MQFTIARFERALAACLPAAPDTELPRLCVALSGGLDSSALLMALAELARERPGRWTLRALHVDHALHDDSAQWGRASADLARALGVAFTEVRIDARPSPGESPEAAAREARYAAFRRLLAPGEVLLTAHHADDQLETILLQWLRGGGLRAFAGMAPLVRLGRGWHARPLLGVERDELEAYARSRGLTWVRDPSNADLRFDRNYLRHAVLPVLQRRWPAAARTASRAAGFARDALALETALAAQDLASVARGRAIDLARLRLLPEGRQRAVLRAWIGALGLPLPAAETLGALRRDADVAAADRNPCTAWPGAAVHRYRGCLHAESAGEEQSFAEGTWCPAETSSHAWSAASRLELQAGTGTGLSRARLPARLRVVRRDGGEQFRPAGGAHRRPLRKWLQERDVLPWRRAGLPLLLDDAGALVAVADLGIAHEYAAQADEPSWQLVWHGRGIVTEADAFCFRWPGDPPIG